MRQRLVTTLASVLLCSIAAPGGARASETWAAPAAQPIPASPPAASPSPPDLPPDAAPPGQPPAGPPPVQSPAGPPPDQPSTEAPYTGPFGPPPPTTAPAAPPEPATVTPEPAPRRPRKGTGFIVGAASAGAAAWGASASLTSLVVGGCTEESTVQECLDAEAAASGLIWLRYVANTAAFGLAIPAGIVRARYDAPGGKARRGTVTMATGGALVGLGILGRILVRYVVWPSVEDCTTQACHRSRLGLYVLGVQGSASMFAAGAGVLVYGLAYHVTRRKAVGLGRRAARHQLVVVPDVGPRYGGLSLAGRF